MSCESSHQEFWRARFPHPVGIVPLPFDHVRPPVPSYLRENVELALSSVTSDGLQRLGAPPCAVVAAAVHALLIRYGGAETIVLGVARQTWPIAESQRTDMPLLPIQSSGSAMRDAPAQKLIETIAHELHEAETHMAYSLRELQGWAGIHDAAFGHRLFNVALCCAEPSGVSAAGWPSSNGALSEFLMQCDVVITAEPSPSQVTLRVEYDADLFEKPTIERMIGHLGKLLDEMTRDASRVLSVLPILTPVEREEILRGFNRTEDESINSDQTLQGLFETQAVLRPAAIAVTFEGESLSYGELNARANQLAHYLKKLGIGPGVFVGLCLERSLEMVVGLLGVLKAGGAYVPIDPEYPADRVAFMIQDATAPVLLVQSRLLPAVPAHRGTVVSLDRDWELIARECSDDPANQTDPNDLAYMIYTSGSTGRPKGAMNAHRGICNRLLWMQRQYRMTDTDTVLQKTPFSFDVSVWEFFWPLIVGARLVLAKPGGHRDPAYLVDVIEAEQVTIMHFVPSMMGAFLAGSGLNRCRSLRHVMCSGEALPFNLQEEFFAALPAELHNLYGPTEAAVDVTHWTCRRSDPRGVVPIGRPVANTQIYILDQHLQPVPIGVAGDLYIGGIQVGRGYHNRPELTAERFIHDHLGRGVSDRLYKTGDLARFLPEGEIEYLGRSDFQVKIRGFRIELGEIESALARHPGIREVVVLAREDVPGTKRLVAYLVSSLSESDLDRIRAYLKTTLPEFMVPSAFVLMDTLPLSPNGKIDRKALPVPLQEQESSGRYVAPRTPMEQKLTDIWSRVLRVARVGVHDNFFELGGDSILSIQAISSARKEGLMMTPTMLFANQTIAELAAVVMATNESHAMEDPVVGDVLLTPVQRWFFEQNLDEPHHFNQAVMLEVVEPLDRGLVDSVLTELEHHHDALRLRFRCDGGKWRQYYSDKTSQSVLHWIDLTGRDAGVQRRLIEETSATMQAGLKLEQGPIWQVGYFRLGHGHHDRLLFVIHHLAVDGVSWRILIEDFEHSYRQLQSGQTASLPGKTVSYKAWAQHLAESAKSHLVRQELSYWQAVTDTKSVRTALEVLPDSGGNNQEGMAKTVMVALSVQETDALLKQIPPVYNTHINDVLLTAFVRAWGRWSGAQTLLIDLEGHGRENILREVDSTRTVGWFTSIFPVRFSCSDRDNEWQPGELLKAVKETLRGVPRRGVGYGLLRYMSGDAPPAVGAQAPIIFNYFGQFDQVVAGSALFRFGQESSGPWRSPKQRRRYTIEINCAVVDGKFEARWTYPERMVGDKGIQALADEYLAALRQVIAHCLTPEAGGWTPSDFPLACLDQSSLDQLLSGQQDVEDVYPLSPIQTLFYSANQTNPGTVFDQWHCTLDGSLEVSVFQRAWQETVQRHPVLRSTIHADGVRDPLQVVHRAVRLAWRLEDWRGIALDQVPVRWQAFLKQDLSIPIDLAQAPAMRFALVQVAESQWKFVWSVPALLLDGWSWPLVFRDASRLYEAFAQGQAVQPEVGRPYRDYVAWLKQQSPNAALEFWKKVLAGVRQPTPIRTDSQQGRKASSVSYVEQPVSVSTGLAEKLQSTARRLQITLNTLVQGGWALQLSRQSGQRDVVFGASFSARPTDLAGSETIVGPFVNNVPIRVAIDPHMKVGDFLRQLHGNLLELSQYQFTPLVDIQRVSEVPWRYRLFDSLVVFQNYLVDESARRFGTHVTLADFSGPVHTNYPVLLLAEPGAELRMTLVCDSRLFGSAMRERWARDLAGLFERMPGAIDGALTELQAGLSEPPPALSDLRSDVQSRVQPVIPPQTKMEQTIAGVWGQMFGVDQVSVDDNFFDIGGHSLLLVRMHARLREVLNLEFPIVALLQHPSIRSLAGYFEKPASRSGSLGEGERLRERAKKQKEALDRSRMLTRKR